jgi:hypothetical protein
LVSKCLNESRSARFRFCSGKNRKSWNRQARDNRGVNGASGLVINELEYLEMAGLNVMLAHDAYPEGHQGGVSIIQNGIRVATNGDLRLEPTPGQWSPVPKAGAREVDRGRNLISVLMSYPDENRDRTGFNPIEYPDLHLSYRVSVRPEGKAFRITVDLSEPLPREWVGRVGFNLELFPGNLFGRTFSCDGLGCGVFPRQPTGPTVCSGGSGDELEPLANGECLVIAPECDRLRMSIQRVQGGELHLIDGRARHDNGWFIVRSLVKPLATEGAIEWLVCPNALPGWIAEPVVQVSQVGYLPEQPKVAVIELDRRDVRRLAVSVLEVLPDGTFRTALYREAEDRGRFLRSSYLTLDFSEVREPGMYVVRYGRSQSEPFRIDPEVFRRGVWQPTLEYFLPVQMCHMRVNGNQRVWHGVCHLDDARMAPTDRLIHDGYRQGASTLCPYESGEHVPGLARGGWHDAGDYDLRIESQADTVHGLALAVEEFGLDYDNTTIDQDNQIVELLRPDGKPDALQQIEHGLLSVLGAYRSLGRLYKGIIEPGLRQYQHLGDASTVTDNRIGPDLGDDRWVFTEENPSHELGCAAALAAASRVLPGYDDSLSQECLQVAETLYDRADHVDPVLRADAALELLIATRGDRYRRFFIENLDAFLIKPERSCWLLARSLHCIEDEEYGAVVKQALSAYRTSLDGAAACTPYGVPYVPRIWGAGWSIQREGVQHYWLHKSCPEIFSIDPILSALNFVLGCHPGSNTSSFVSGVGTRSVMQGYGVNRADESYIPGGIVSGTALIRPDLPELLSWPHLWQQTEYCVGYPTVDFIFLVLAAERVIELGADLAPAV